MSKHLQRDLEGLKKAILTMGAMVEESIRKAVSALQGRSAAAAEDVIRGDDRIDEAEVTIEEECLHLLALHQPVAEDLRFIAAVLKINSDLERMGDLAVNIAERAKALATAEPFDTPPQLRAMADGAMRMVRESLDAFVRQDEEGARRILAEDREVDQLNREILGDLQARMEREPATVRRATHLFSASKYLERIADHATNIAEDVVYLIQGEIIRHRPRLKGPSGEN